MGFSAVIATASLATTAYSTVRQLEAQKEQKKYQQEGIVAQQKAEASRKQAMELDSMRRRREIVRQSIRARSLALSTAVSQGASGGSGLQGGLAEISGQTSTNLLGVEQNRQIGSDLFSANQERFGADSRAVGAASRAATWGGVSALSQTILKNTGTIDRVGTTLFNKAGSIFSNSAK